MLMGWKPRTRLPSAKYRKEKLQKRIRRSNDRGQSLSELHPSSTVSLKSHKSRQGQWPVKARVLRSSGPRCPVGRWMCNAPESPTSVTHNAIVPAIQWANAEDTNTDGCHPRCEYTRSAVIQRVAHESTKWKHTQVWVAREDDRAQTTGERKNTTDTL